MKTKRDRLALRLSKDRKRVPVTIKLPEDVIEELQDLAAIHGWENYLTLLKAYISRGLRNDMELHGASPAFELAESLREQGLTPEQVRDVVEDSKLKVA